MEGFTEEWTDLTKWELNKLERKKAKPRRVSELSTALEAKEKKDTGLNV